MDHEAFASLHRISGTNCLLIFGPVTWVVTSSQEGLRHTCLRALNRRRRFCEQYYLRTADKSTFIIIFVYYDRAIYGCSRSFEVIYFCCNRKPRYDFLFVINHLSSTLWFKKPDPCYVFWQLHRIWLNISNFWFRESTVFSLQISNWRVLMILCTSFDFLDGNNHLQQTTLKWVCTKRAIF